MTSLSISDVIELLDEEATPEEQALFDQLITERDPIACLLDPAFDKVTWEYSGSHTGSDIPGKLHAKQLEVLNSTAKHRWLFWGNQVGKTTVGAIDLVLLCLGRHPVQKWKPPVTCWASALTWELWEKILLPELLTWIPSDRIIDAPTPHKQSTKRDILIRADNGSTSRIIGKAAQQGRAIYQSARIHRLWADEEHPEDVWDEIQPRLLRYGGDTISTMTPLKGLTWPYHRVYEPWKSGKTNPDQHFITHAGLADNPSIDAKSIEAITAELQHNPAQLAARLHGHFVRPSGLVLPFDPEKHFETITQTHISAWLRNGGKAYAAIDFGSWRFAFGLAITTTDGELRLIDEMFSQREDLEQRARKITRIMQERGIPEDTVIVGDCANPTDITELELAFQRISSPYHVIPVDAHNKIRMAGVERLENLLNRGAFKIRKGLGEDQTWLLGQNAARSGKPIMGSRFVWEINNWQYPNDDNGKAQKDDPDDHSADGADMMAMIRYLVMFWWQKSEPTVNEPIRREDEHPGFEQIDGQIVIRDERRYHEQEPEYRIPQYRMPWDF